MSENTIQQPPVTLVTTNERIIILLNSLFEMFCYVMLYYMYMYMYDLN
jgi:hypothetical protein